MTDESRQEVGEGSGEVDAPDRWKKIKVNLITSGVVVGVIILLLAIPKWGYRSPCAWLQRHDYERRFYVFLYPRAGETKAYRVPALIEATATSRYEDLERHYRLAYAIMPNGGTIVFDDRDTSLVPYQRVSLIDKQGREWAAELTCDPAD